MKLISLILIILISYSTIFSQSTPPSNYNAPTDRIAHLPPAETGALDMNAVGHGANYTFTDPIFGSQITRITTENFWLDMPGRNHMPPDTAEVRSISINSTKFILLNIEGGVITPMFWNGTTKQASRMGSSLLASGGIWLSGIVDGGSVIPSWSGKDDNILWGMLGYKLRKLDFSSINSSSTTIPFTEILNLQTVYTAIGEGTLTGSVCSLGVSGVDATNDFITTAFADGVQDDWTKAIWYNSSTGAYKVLDLSTSPIRYWNSLTSSWTDIVGINGGLSLHNIKMDQSGRFVLLSIDGRDMGLLPAGKGALASWDTTNNSISFTPLSLDGGHRSGGWQKMVNQYPNGSDATQWLLRPADDLSVFTNLIVPLLSDASSNPQYPAMNPDFDEHSSWQTARSSNNYPVFSITSRDVPISGAKPWRPYDNEGIAIGTTGASVVYRLFHHHSNRMSGGVRTVGYYDYSFGQVSADGKFMLFSSNWNLTLHYPTGTNPNTGVNCAPNCYRIETFMATLPVSATATKCNWNTNPTCN